MMLHTHSNYSLLQGAVSIDDLIGRAKSFGMKALALTDRNGMYGLIQFYKSH
ncbi:MAG: PHP domain-containing protein [Ignavibacteriales bacterium]|nr:PHP domain-containing protein [Ignavibacteriales bacterium]